MVAMIDRLVKAGLVVREPSHTDRRVKHVLLTEAGAKLYGQVKTEAESFRRRLLEHVDPDSLRTATELLEKIQGIVETLP
jgi:MarR family transcriptional regulator for hemolysin